MKQLAVIIAFFIFPSCNNVGVEGDTGQTIDTIITTTVPTDTFTKPPISTPSQIENEPEEIDTIPKLSCDFLKGSWKATITSQSDGEEYHESVVFECFDTYKLRLKSGFQSLLAFQGEAVGSLNSLNSRNYRGETTSLYLERQGNIIFGSLKRKISSDSYSSYSVLFEK